MKHPWPFTALCFPEGHAVAIALIDVADIDRDVDFDRLEQAGSCNLSASERAEVAQVIERVAHLYELQRRRLPPDELRKVRKRVQQRQGRAADDPFTENEPEDAFLVEACARGAQPLRLPRGRPIDAAVHVAVEGLVPIWRRAEPGRVGITFDPVEQKWTGSLVEFVQEALRQAGVRDDRRRTIARKIQELDADD